MDMSNAICYALGIYGYVRLAPTVSTNHCSRTVLKPCLPLALSSVLWRDDGRAVFHIDGNNDEGENCPTYPRFAMNSGRFS